MRWLAVCVLLVACARDDRAEQSAKTVAATAAAQPATTLALQPTGCGASPASCNGGASCGGQCGGATADAPVWATVPPGAHWTELRVTGMHCGESIEANGAPGEVWDGMMGKRGRVCVKW